MEVQPSPSVGQPDHRPKASFWIATPHAMDADMTCSVSTWKAYYWTWTQDIPKSYLRVKRRVWCLPINFQVSHLLHYGAINERSLARNCMSPLIARPIYQPGFDSGAISGLCFGWCAVRIPSRISISCIKFLLRHVMKICVRYLW